MNDVIDTIVTRRSVRKYKPDMLPQEIIEQVVKAGTYAPTGMGYQSPIIIAVKSQEIRNRLSKVNAEIAGIPGSDPFYGAPVVLIVLADKNRSTFVNDGSLVMGNLLLAAHSLGIGSCWIHRAKETFEREEGKEILKLLGITGDYEGIGHCILGYPDEPERTAPPRKADYVYYL